MNGRGNIFFCVVIEFQDSKFWLKPNTDMSFLGSSCYSPRHGPIHSDSTELVASRSSQSWSHGIIKVGSSRSSSSTIQLLQILPPKYHLSEL